MSRLDDAFLGVHYAHRGLHDTAAGIAENSPESFRKAVDAGYGIELDLRLSACGEAMVFHDATLDRMAARSGLVIDHDAKALGAMDLVGGGGAIPRLCDVLEMVDGRVPMLLEMKTDGDGGEDLARRVASTINDSRGPLAVKSYDAYAVRMAVRYSLGTPCGLVVGDAAPPPIAVELLEEFDFLSWQAKNLPDESVAALRLNGVAVFAWTVRSEQEQARLAGHVDGVIFEQYRPAL